MEWPSNSRLILDRQNFPGQHNSFGSGIWVAATRADGAAVLVLRGRLQLERRPRPRRRRPQLARRAPRIENYPVLESGDLNPAYNPDEAEEIIISEWDTPAGIRVTRTSRAWSYPGYDSFIIYEYEFTNV
jgi:hypothetical protein